MFTCYLGHPWCNRCVPPWRREDLEDLLGRLEIPLIKGYGNLRDPPPETVDESVDQPHPAKSLAYKLGSSLQRPPRDTPANRRMAQRNGWSDEQFAAWVAGDTGDEDIRDG